MSGSHLDGGSLVVLFIIITLTLGMVAREINKRLGIPYTPLLIILGGILGAAQSFGDITKATDNVMKIEPHAILVLLLPLLIFESAYNSHTEVLTKNFWQVILLVGPGVLAQTFFLSVIVYYVLGYGGDGPTDMNYESTLVLGSILATTDPVAVVALLKELGAPLHIETLIEMESLFNDGVAMVFFNIFVKLAQGEELSAGDAFGQFFLLAFGGPALGVAFGLGALILLKILTRGTTLFITIVVLLAYTTFLTAEKFCEGKVSGLLALVIVGILMNVQAKDYMTNKQKSAVKMILSYLQFVSETVLFFMSGVFIGDILIYKPSQGGTDNYIKGDDWWKLIVLYLFLNLGRFLMFLTFLWPLKKLGEGMTWKETFVAVWGGLRGALALALGLIIYADEAKEKGINATTQSRILFHVCGIATMTLLINGTTCGYLVDILGLISNSNVKLKFKQQYLKEVKEEGKRQREVLNANSHFDMVEWKGVDELVNLKELEQKQGYNENITYHADFKKRDKKSNYKHLGHHKEGSSGGFPNTLGLGDFDMESGRKENGTTTHANGVNSNGNGTTKNANGSLASEGDLKFKKLKSFKEKTEKQVLSYQEEEYQKIRYNFLRIFMKIISHTKSKEWISNKVFQLIYDAAEENTERLKHPISIWHLLKESMASERKLHIMYRLSKIKIIDYWFHLELEYIHEMVYIFTTCINEAKSYIKENSVNVHSRNVRKTHDMNIIMKEFDDDFYKAKAYMRKIKKTYFEVLGKLEQRKAAIKIIMAQAKMVDEHINTNYIPEKEGNEIKNYLSEKIEKLNSIHTLVKLTSQSEDKIEVFFKDSIDQNELKHLIYSSSAQKFEAGEDILKFDEDAEYIYYIAHGEIEEIIIPVEEEVSTDKQVITFAQGQVVGLTNLVDPDEKSLITLRATEETNVVALPIAELREYYFNNGKFEEFCIKKCLYQFLHLSQRSTSLWGQWGSKNVDEINKIAQESICVRLNIEEPIRLEFGGYMFAGLLISQDGFESIESYSLIPAGQYFIAKDISILLEFKKIRNKNVTDTLNVDDNRGFKNKTRAGDPMNLSYQQRRKMSITGTARQTPKNSMMVDQQAQLTYNNFGNYHHATTVDPENIKSSNAHQPSNSVKTIKDSKISSEEKYVSKVVHTNHRQMQGGLMKQRKGKTSEAEEVDEEIVNVKNAQCTGDDGALESQFETGSQYGYTYMNRSVRHQDSVNRTNMDELQSMNEHTEQNKMRRKQSMGMSQTPSLHDRRNSIEQQKHQAIIEKLNLTEIQKAQDAYTNVQVLPIAGAQASIKKKKVKESQEKSPSNKLSSENKVQSQNGFSAIDNGIPLSSVSSISQQQ